MRLSSRAYRGPGIDVDPEAVRRARLDQGLTLAEVAGGHVSRAAIHAIETGRSRPTAATLQQIAEATGRPTASFVRSGVANDQAAVAAAGVDAVAQLRRLLLGGDLDKVLEVASTILGGATSDRSRGWINLLLAEALLHKGDAARALAQVEAATLSFKGAGDRHGAVRAMLIEARTRRLKGDVNSAPLLRRALREAHRLHPATRLLEAEIGCELIALHLDDGDLTRARAVYAGTRLEDFLSGPQSAALNYDEMASAFELAGDLASARQFSERAIALYELGRFGGRVGEVTAKLALDLLQNGQGVDAARFMRLAARLVGDGHPSAA